MIEQQERDKVHIMMIIPRSAEVSLPVDVPRCDMTANDVLQNRLSNGLNAMLQLLCDICEM